VFGFFKKKKKDKKDPYLDLYPVSSNNTARVPIDAPQNFKVPAREPVEVHNDIEMKAQSFMDLPENHYLCEVSKVADRKIYLGNDKHFYYQSMITKPLEPNSIVLKPLLKFNGDRIENLCAMVFIMDDLNVFVLLKDLKNKNLIPEDIKLESAELITKEMGLIAIEGRNTSFEIFRKLN